MRLGMKSSLTLLVTSLSAGIAACAPDPATQLNCRSVSQLDVSSANELQQVYAQEIAERAKEVRVQISESSTATGFIGNIVGRIGGTDAYDIGFRIGRLRELIARYVALGQARHNDGQVLVPIEQSWACELLADSIVSLDRVQGKKQLLEALEEVEQLFGKARHEGGK